MFVYAVAAAARSTYLVTVEVARTESPALDALTMFAAGAASAREGGPMGASHVVGQRDYPNHCHVVVSVSVENPDVWPCCGVSTRDYCAC